MNIRDGVVAVHPCGHLFHYVPDKIWKKITEEEATARVLRGASALRQQEDCRDCLLKQRYGESLRKFKR